MKENINKLKSISKEIRKKIIEISFIKRSHHIGSQFSAVEILVTLFFKILKKNSKNFYDLNKDIFLLSKGHAALVYYIILSMKGCFSEKKLISEYLSDGGKLGGHPDYKSMKGIEISSGALGHCLSIGAGIALSKKRDKKNGNVYVLLSDGEINEGMIWESVMFSAHHKLNNLIVIIDNNKIQALGHSKDIINMNSINEKFKSFNWNVKEVNGHDLKDLIKNLNKKNYSKPLIIIANTIKGKGLLSMENKLSSHYEVIKDKKTKNYYLNNIY